MSRHLASGSRGGILDALASIPGDDGGRLLFEASRTGGSRVQAFLQLRFWPLLRRFGDTGILVLTRPAAFLLLAIGVDIVWSGLAEFIRAT